MSFVVKYILSDVSISTPAFLSFSFAWNIFFYLLTFNLYVSFTVRWVSCIVALVFSYFFFIQSTTLYLLAASFSPLTFKVIVDKYVFIAISNFVFHLVLCFSFVPFLFLVWWFPFHLCLCSLLFSFCECNVWFDLWLPCFWSMLTPSYICLL